MFDDLDQFQPIVVSSPVSKRRRRSPLDGRQEQWTARQRQDASVPVEPLIRYIFFVKYFFTYIDLHFFFFTYIDLHF